MREMRDVLSELAVKWNRRCDFADEITIHGLVSDADRFLQGLPEK